MYDDQIRAKYFLRKVIIDWLIEWSFISPVIDCKLSVVNEEKWAI